MSDDERFRNAVIYGTSHPEMYMTPREEIERLRAENEKLRLELDMQQATVMVPSQKDDRRTIDRLNEALVAALDEAAKLRKALQPFAAMTFLNNMQEYAEAPDECVMTAGSWGNKPLLTFRLGHLRAAAAALKETGDE